MGKLAEGEELGSNLLYVGQGAPASSGGRGSWQRRTGAAPAPLAGGLHTGKYQRGQPAPESTRLGRVPALGAEMLQEQNFDIVDALQRFAIEHSCSILDIAIGGLAAQPQVVSVIPGAMSPEQVNANVRAALWRPSPDELEELNRITRLARA